MKLSCSLISRVWLLGSLYLGSCIDRIDIDEDKYKDLLVVEGLITNVEEPYIVKLSRTARYTDQVVSKESGAIVYIVDESNNMMLLNETEPGIYKSSEKSIRAEVGGSYKLRIETVGDGIYESSYEIMPEVPDVESIDWDFKTVQYYDKNNELKEKQAVFFNASFKDDAGVKNFYKWEYESVAEVYAQLAQPPYSICWSVEYPVYYVHVFDDANTDGSYLRNYPIVSVDIDYRFARNYLFKAKLHSLNENAYIFWKSVEDQVKNVGTIFDPPPSQIKGNIKNVNNPDELVLGYFEASAVSESKMLIKPSDVPFAILETNCSLYTGGPGPPPPTCTNCLSYENSTNIKPDDFK